MSKRRFIFVEHRGRGFTANGYDSELKIYITIVDCEEERYIDVKELQLEADGAPTALGWFRDLGYSKIATEISEAEFRTILQDAIDRGLPIENKTGNRFEEYLNSDIQESNEPPLESIRIKIDIPHNRSIASDLKSIIDVCDFGTVKRYFSSPDTEISQVMLVQEPYDLEVVGAFFVDPSGHIGLARGGLFTRGIVKAGVDDLDKVKASFRNYAILLDTIEDDEACHVLYLPPAYIVKFSGKKYR